MTNLLEIGKNIVLLRNEQGLTQEEAAFRSKLSVSRLQDIEHGCQNTAVDTLIRISETLGVDSRVLGIFSRTEKSILLEVRRWNLLQKRNGGALQICENIVLVRKAEGLTQTQLANLAHVSPTCLRDIEHGCANATVVKLVRIADALGLSLTELGTLSMPEEEILESVRNAKSMAGLRIQ